MQNFEKIALSEPYKIQLNIEKNNLYIFITSPIREYRVSHFGHFYGISPLFLMLAGCGFRDSVLLFCETKDGAISFCIALLVFAIQGGNEKYHFLMTPRISVVLKLGGMVKTHSYRFFSVESSGVVSFSIELSVFELLSKHMFFKWDTLYFIFYSD